MKSPYLDLKRREKKLFFKREKGCLQSKAAFVIELNDH